MSLPALAEPDLTSLGDVTTSRRVGPHPAVSAIIAAVGLWFTFPPTGWNWLAWVALVPLFLLVESPRSAASVYAGAWAGGFAFWLLAIQWIRLTDPDAWVGWVVMALVLSVWWPAFLGIARVAVRRLKVPLIIAAPVVWVALEYIRAHIMSGFPWYYLAHSQHDILPLIQIADITGALGLSFLIAAVNAWLAELWTQPILEQVSPERSRLARPHLIRALTVVPALAATLGYGFYRIETARFQDGPRVALLQSNLIQSNKMSARAPQLLGIYRALVERAMQETNRPDLIVWPETSNPYHFIVRDPKLNDAGFDGLARKVFPETDGREWMDLLRRNSDLLHGWADHIQVPMMVGMLTYEFNASGFEKYNTAILVEPRVTTVQRYSKVHLVPFGEYVPLIKYFPWLVALTPYQGSYVPSLSFGTSFDHLKLGRYRLATAICFEDTIPQAVRHFFEPRAGTQQPDVLINITNDGWFHGSSEHDMHLAISVFRAVENRVPMARAVNTGPSALIDGNGKVISKLPKLSEGVLSGVVPLDDRQTVYSAWGDWLGRSCLILTVCVLLGPFVQFFATKRAS